MVGEHEVERELRVQAGEFGQGRRKAEGGQGDGRGDAQTAVRTERRAADQRVGLFEVGQELRAPFVVGEAFVARAHAAGGPVQKAYPKLGFELGHMARYGGGR